MPSFSNVMLSLSKHTRCSATTRVSSPPFDKLRVTRGVLCALVLVAACAAGVSASPLSDVQGAMILLAKANSYHISISSPEGKSGEVDMVKPDKMHMVFAPMEMIRIGATTYMKMNGTWRQFTLPGAESVSALYRGAIDRATHPSASVTVVDLGMKTVDGAPLHAYAMKDTAASDPATVYLDDKGQPVRLETKNGSVIRISNINGPITINAPM
jgi:hypothetical protein